MRKHGWQLPYHPLQVVAVAVFGIGICFLCLLCTFVGKQLLQYIVMGLYTPLIISAFGLDANAASIGENASGISNKGAEPAADHNETEQKITATRQRSCSSGLLALLPCALISNCAGRHEESSQEQLSEDGMFYCSLCEVEVFKYSKHCRVCDKCVDQFDHHCRWINNCIGKRNLPQVLHAMVSALLLEAVSPLFPEHGGGCLYHIGHDSNPATCSTLLLSHTSHKEGASSFNTFHRAAWCTPPRLFVEDQYDVVPPDTVSVSSLGKRSTVEEPIKKRNPAAVKISPWTLARLNAEDVSKAAAEARKKSADNNRRRASKRVRLPAELPFETLSKIPSDIAQNSRRPMITESSSSLAPLFSLKQEDFRTSRRTAHLRCCCCFFTLRKDIPLSRSTSDGYEASGGEDSHLCLPDLQRSTRWSSILGSDQQDDRVRRLMIPSSSSQANIRKH
ncbi:hypothetical protein HAX54_043748 [Datura stramonium]|uniref:S-acyltransferase n=1 Tax=Datura stramonium TaxID=4076 RepID=A0ABS8W528_DATST|nr:hypothetical protein [Datura stramonium]